ncbi:MAG: UDP-3-O-(3-hydroxymyristoyl)glucosamine N-acyltransferase [Pseudomonadota bacterium]
MPDRRFFTMETPLSFGDAARAISAQAPSQTGEICRVASPNEDNLEGALIYCANAITAALLSTKSFGLCLTTAQHAGEIDAGPLAIVASPKLAFATLASRLHLSREEHARRPANETEVHESAEIHPTTIIGPGAQVNAGVRIGPHCSIGCGVVLGENTVIEAGVSITHAIVGEQVRILSGARLGQAGFGFVEGAAGLVRMPQLGRVIVGNHVEIGANTTVDRGALADTVIGEGTKIDNLVQIGHNVQIGRYCILAAQTGVSGSCNIGDGVMIGGQVGLADHLNIGAGAQIAAGAGLMRDVPPGAKWGGRPARPAKDWLRETATLAKLAKKKNG